MGGAIINSKIKSDLVKSRRKALGWTQMDLAIKAGLSMDTVHRVESGRIKTFTKPVLVLLASALGCAPEELLVSDNYASEGEQCPVLKPE